MAAQFCVCLRANTLRIYGIPTSQKRKAQFVTSLPERVKTNERRRTEARVSDGSSYLDLWKNAKDRERKSIEFQKIAENPSEIRDSIVEESPEVFNRKNDQFRKILEVPTEERDRIQRMQVIDRAAAAIAAARALLQENPPPMDALIDSGSPVNDSSKTESKGEMGIQPEGKQAEKLFVSQSDISGHGAPGPNFWSWTPPLNNEGSLEDDSNAQNARKPNSYLNSTSSVLEKEQSIDFLPIPFESTSYESNNYLPLPPLQSRMGIGKEDISNSITELLSEGEESELGMQFSNHAAEAADALGKVVEELPHGVNPDGSKWWRETGIEKRPNGVVCKWTLTRGVSADEAVEWEEKFWEAADQFEYKELGSEKSGRDAAGNVWHEFWKESMWQDLSSGLVHMEKTADKWGKNGKGDEWHEKWWEHYDASGQAEKWAHKWCSIDPNTPLEAGHAHIWHERWGEKYDGQGSSTKYTDKWAERSEEYGWTKWGDKWDENFGQNGHGVKQGETWWEGEQGERWNRTWGERHNGSGWVHKYGKSSNGEHWDTHVPQETWYERYPHYGFQHCFDNSVQLREVRKPRPETS